MDTHSSKLCYKIGEACRAVDIQPYVLRYWETEFPALQPTKSRSGQRVYTELELGIIRRIKELLYHEGYTIAGAKKKLEAEMTVQAGLLDLPESEPGQDREIAIAAGAAGNEGAGRKPRRRPRNSSVEGAAGDPQTSSGDEGLDTTKDERIETLRRGLRELLEEARVLLRLLDNPPSSKTSRSGRGAAW